MKYLQRYTPKECHCCIITCIIQTVGSCVIITLGTKKWNLCQRFMCTVLSVTSQRFVVLVCQSCVHSVMPSLFTLYWNGVMNGRFSHSLRGIISVLIMMPVSSSMS